LRKDHTLHQQHITAADFTIEQMNRAMSDMIYWKEFQGIPFQYTMFYLNGSFWQKPQRRDVVHAWHGMHSTMGKMSSANAWH
jgi:hypothetical protein